VGGSVKWYIIYKSVHVEKNGPFLRENDHSFEEKQERFRAYGVYS